MNNNDHNILSNKRDEFLVGIRKQGTQKKINESRKKFCIENQTNNDQNAQKKAESIQKLTLLKAQLEKFYQSSPEETQAIIKEVRKVLCDFKNPKDIPNKEFQELGYQFYIILFLGNDYDAYNDLQADSLWIVSNFACCGSELLQRVLETTNQLDLVIRFIFDGNKINLINNVQWFISNATDNIAEESVLKVVLLEKGVFHRILEITIKLYEKLVFTAKNKLDIQIPQNQEIMKILSVAVWTFSNLLKGEPFPPEEYNKPVYQQIACLAFNLLQLDLSESMNEDCITCLYNFLQDDRNRNTQERIIFFMGFQDIEGILTRIGSKCFKTNNIPTKLIVRVLSQIGLIISFSYDDDNNYISRFIETDVCKFFVYCLESNNKKLEQLAAWNISNIFLENTPTFHELLEDKYLMGKIIGKLASTNYFNTKVELSIAIFNLSHVCAVHKVLSFLTNYKDIVFYAILDCLDGCNESKIIHNSLNTMINFLRLGTVLSNETNNSTNQVLEEFLKQANIQNLEDLQKNPDVKIYEKVSKIFENYNI